MRLWKETKQMASVSVELPDHSNTRRKKNARVEKHQWKRKRASATQLAHLARLEELYFAVEKEYVPQPNNVDLTLIHAEYFFAKFELPEGYGWAKLTDSLRVVKVSGSHSTMFDKRFIDEVRSAFLAALKR